MGKPHRAWLICLGGVLSLLTVMGLGVNTFTIYQPEIIALNGFTNAQGSWITTTRTLFILASLLCVNQLCARFSLRLVMTLGVFFVGVSCFCFGLSTTFPMYCFSAALTGIGYCLGGMVSLAIIIGNWFDSRRGLALGIASGGSGISTVFAPAMVTALIRTAGLRWAFFVEGGLILALGCVVWLLLRDAPADTGLTPYRTADWAPAEIRQSESPDHGRWPIRVLLLAAFLLGGPVGPAFTHITVLLTTEGYDPMVVAGLISYAGVVLVGGKVLAGQLYDRLGALISNYIILASMLAGLLLCCLTDRVSLTLAVAAITCMFFGMSVTGASPAVWARDLAPAADYARVVRAITTAYTFGMLVMGPIPGILADRYGSYIPAYLFFAALHLILSLLVQGVYHRLKVGRRPVKDPSATGR